MSARTRTALQQLPRSAARLAAVQALYEIALTNADAEGILQDFLGQRWPRSGATETLPAPDLNLLARLVRGTTGSLDAIDADINAVLLARRRSADVELLLRALLRVAACELQFVTTTPAKVIINEYVNVAHAFFSGGEPALVNAVLDRLACVYRGAI